MERGDRRHAVAADVEHDAAVRQIGAILDEEARDRTGALVETAELRERRASVEGSGGPPGLDDDARVTGGQPISLGAQAGRRAGADVGMRCRRQRHDPGT